MERDLVVVAGAGQRETQVQLDVMLAVVARSISPVPKILPAASIATTCVQS